MNEQDLQAANQLINTANAAAANYAIMSGKSDHRTMNYNKELMKIQHEYNIEDFYRQADYNSPGQSIERLRGAGLNPLLHDLQGNATGMQGVSLGSAPNSSESANQAQSNYIAAMNANLTAQSIQVAKKNADTERINAETARQNAETQKFKVEVDAGLTTEQTKYQQLQSAYQQFVNDHNQERFDAEMRKIFGETEELETRAGVNRSEVSVNEQKIKNLVQDLINGKQITAAQVKALSAQAADTLAHVKVNDATVDYIKTEDFGKRIQNFVDAYTMENKLSFSAYQNVKISEEIKILMENAFNAIKEGKRLDAVTKQIENDIDNANLDDKSKAVMNLVTMGIFGRFFGAKGAAATPFIRKYEKVNGQEVPIFNLFGQ